MEPDEQVEQTHMHAISITTPRFPFYALTGLFSSVLLFLLYVSWVGFGRVEKSLENWIDFLMDFWMDFGMVFGAKLELNPRQIDPRRVQKPDRS